MDDRRHAAVGDLLRDSGRRPVRLGLRRARRHPTRPARAGIASPAAEDRGGGPARGHPAVVRLLPRQLRHPLSVRGVPPGVRARLQRRGDGEPRLRDAAGQHDLPRPGDGHRARPQGRCRGPRDGPHVVRRPGHHAVVGRPVAERVLRRVPGAPVLHRGDPLSAVGGLRHRAQGLGRGGRPVTIHPSRGRQRGRKRRGGAAVVRRNLLRQGRRRVEAAGELPG